MSPEISERSFEEAIECGLLQHGPGLPAEASAKAGAKTFRSAFVRTNARPTP